MKWLYEENGVPLIEQVFEQAVRCGKIENMKWLYEQKCHWGKFTFSQAAKHGDLDNMKWLYEKSCPWGEYTFNHAAYYGSLENLNWLLEKECPWGIATIAAFCREQNNPPKESIIQWMQANGCPTE